MKLFYYIFWFYRYMSLRKVLTNWLICFAKNNVYSFIHAICISNDLCSTFGIKDKQIYSIIEQIKMLYKIPKKKCLFFRDRNSAITVENAFSE